ncbi:MAG: CopG family transcriptional regulator [Planctomycetes bacterium]|nr:CopG family transcriptional regulator [Planctomycetota bacterium]
MARAKIAITLEAGTLDRLDRLLERRVFRSRSGAIQVAVAEKLSRMERSRLARECARLDPRAERRIAEEGMSLEATEWPAY